MLVAKLAAITGLLTALTASVPSSSPKNLDVEEMSSANILGSTKGVNRGMIIRTCLNASTHLASHHFVSAAADTDIRLANVVFLMMRRASTCGDIIKKREKARHA
jgi:hypothetical protein